MHYKRLVIPTREFRKQYRTILKQKPQLKAQFEKIIEVLANDKIIPPNYYDHKLQGQKFEVRELHIKPDLLLLYTKSKTELILTLIETGSHSDLF